MEVFDRDLQRRAALLRKENEQMKINKNELVKCLEIVSNALGHIGSAFTNQCFGFFEDLISTSNGTITIESRLPFDSGLKCWVRGQVFLDLVKSLPGDELEIIVGDAELELKAGKVKGKFNISPMSSYKSVETRESGINEQASVNEFVGGLIACRRVAAKSETFGPLCGVNINDNYIIATDRTRIIKYTVPSPITCTIPSEFVDVITKYKDSINRISFGPDVNLVAEMSEYTTKISTVLYVDKYPDLNQYFPKKNEECCVVSFTEGLKEAISRHSMILKDVDIADRITSISIADDQCDITTINPDLGTLKETLTLTRPVEKPIKFCINPLLFSEIVKDHSSFTFYPSTKLMLFESDNLRYLAQTIKEI